MYVLKMRAYFAAADDFSCTNVVLNFLCSRHKKSSVTRESTIPSIQVRFNFKF